ncbi:MAG: hypothetical protein V3T23_10695 [Nitrososphaerales archaeon]
MRIQEICENTEDIVKKHNITKRGKNSTGLDEEKGIWYGWSHRAVVGFEIGDKVFEEDFGDDKTDFKEHGSKTIKTLDDAKLSAERFSDHVS